MTRKFLTHRLTFLFCALLTVALLLAGCGGNDGASDTSAAPVGSEATESAVPDVPSAAKAEDITPLALPDSPPPLVENIGDWADVAGPENVLPPFSNIDENGENTSFPEQICDGYLYGKVIKQNEEAKLSANPPFTINRIEENAEGRLEDSKNILIKATHEDATIMDFAASKERLFWVEASINAGENTGWKIYEHTFATDTTRSIDGNNTPNNERVVEHLPGNLYIDGNRLIYSCYDPSPEKYVVRIFDAEAEQHRTLFYEPSNGEESSSFYMPKLSGDYAIWTQDTDFGGSQIILCDLRDGSVRSIGDEKNSFNYAAINGNYLALQHVQNDDTSGSNDLWIYDIKADRWLARISAELAPYQDSADDTGLEPSGFFWPQIDGDRMVWHTDPFVFRAYVLDLNNLTLYPVPKSADGQQMSGLTLNDGALYWKVDEANADFYKATLKSAS